MAFSTVNAGDEVLAEHITEIQGSLTGESSAGVQILLTDFASASNESLVVQNSLGRQVNVKAANGNSLLKVWDAETTILSADGTKGVTIDDSAVTITGLTLDSFALTGVGTFPAGSSTAPSAAWVDSTLGLYRAGSGRLGLASGTSTEIITFGSGNSTGLLQAVQGQGTAAAGDTTTLTKGGLQLAQGDFGSFTAATAKMVDNRELAPLWAYSVVDSGDGLGDHRTAKIWQYIMDGKGGLHKGLDVQVIGWDLWTTGQTSEDSQIIGIEVQAHSKPLVNTHDSLITGLLVTAIGENTNDTVQGLEVVLGTRNDSNTTPSQRLALILSTKDNHRSRRGGTDALIMFGRKASSAGDFTNVQPWLNGIILGDYAGDIEAWPFQSDSMLIHSDPNLAAGVSNIIGDIINMENTVVNGSIVKVKDSSGNIELDILGTGWIGIGMTPSHPLAIYDDGVSSAMRLRGSSFLTSTSLAIPANATRWLQVSYWDGAAYQTGKVPIF